MGKANRKLDVDLRHCPVTQEGREAKELKENQNRLEGGLCIGWSFLLWVLRPGDVLSSYRVPIWKPCP